MGDLGTFVGICTKPTGVVFRNDGSVIEGLYAAGNDRQNVIGDNCPGAGVTHGANMAFGFVTGNRLADTAGRGEAPPSS